MDLTPPSQKVRFEQYELNLQTGDLRKHELRVRLQRQPARLLVLLVSRQGNVVSRDELRKELWPDDTFVDFDHGLNNAINRLREILCDSASEPRFIETIPKLGYRFIASVEQVDSPQSALFTTPPPKQTGTNDAIGTAVSAFPSRLRPFAIGSALIMTLFLLLLTTGARRTSAVRGRFDSIAVIPLANLTGDPAEEYLSDGMTDALITRLAQLKSLRVISRTSVMHYKHSDKTLSQIAHELEVSTILEGSVTVSGQHVRLNAQLVDARTDTHLWANTYERDFRDLLELQAELTQAVASEVRARLGGDDRPHRDHTPSLNPAAYEAYLKGRYFLAEYQGIEMAQRYFQEAIRLEPNYALAHAALAESYSWNAGMMEQARSEAEAALQIDPDIEQAHLALAWVKHTADWDSAGAEAEYQKALELSPADATIHENHGFFLAQHGKVSEAIAEMEFARLSNPISSKLNIQYGLVLYLARRYDESLQRFASAMEISSSSDIARQILRTYEQMGDYPHAIALYPQAAKWWDLDADTAARESAELQTAYSTSGPRGYWLTRLRQEEQRRPQNPWLIAQIHVHLQNDDIAFVALKQLCDEHDNGIRWFLKADPQFDTLRGDERYRDLLDCIRMAE